MNTHLTAPLAQVLTGSSGFNLIRGDDGGDLIRGKAGFDFLEGFGGDDFLFGGRGNDRLTGGEGNDYLVGGSGRDTFVFNFSEGDTGVDRIADFKPGKDHILVIYPAKLGEYSVGYDAHTGLVTVDDGGSHVIAKLAKGLDIGDADFVLA